MQVKEFLSQATSIDTMIKSKLEQLEKSKSLSMKVISNLKGNRIDVSDEKNNEVVENIIVKMKNFENTLKDDIDRYVDLRREIEDTVNLTSDVNYRLILQLRYIAGKPWDEIADTLGYDLRTVYRLHTKAIKEIESKWKPYKKSS
jgi:RNA polymerase sigma factor (sigma-70 family)